MHHLMHHRWPGNVRQLENAIEYAFARAQGDALMLSLFPPDADGAGPKVSGATADNTEAQIILGALERHRWHHGKAAEELGISRTTLWRRMRKLGIETSPPE